MTNATRNTQRGRLFCDAIRERDVAERLAAIEARSAELSARADALLARVEALEGGDYVARG